MNETLTKNKNNTANKMEIEVKSFACHLKIIFKLELGFQM